MTNRLTLAGIALTPILLGIAWWLEPRLPPSVPPLLLAVWALFWWRRGDPRAALGMAVISVATAAILVMITFVHLAESGRP